MALLTQLKDEMKNAMRDKNKLKLGVVRMAISSVRQVEIDTKTELDDTAIVGVLTKMVKQRKDSAAVYVEGGRQELADKELAEIVELEEFLPKPLTPEEIKGLISQAITDTGAASVADMGKVMAILKPAMLGKADLAAVSGQVKIALS
jgi:hypothetical protein